MDIPVVLITYKRPHHTQQVLEALRKFEIQNLFIYSDGPKNDIDLSGVYETRSLLYRIDWTNPIILERENNIGLASSITSAANDVFKSHDKLILLEDDCVPQKHFFQFMETCLSRYEKDESVFGISGYTLPLPQNIHDSYPYDLYFSPRIGSWGWGTWKSAWEKHITNLENAFWDAIQRGVDLTQGGNDVPVMIRQFLSGQLKDVWTLNWLVTVYINKGYYVYPTFSHIKNIGMDGSGVHCGHTAKFNTTYAEKKATRFPEDIILDQTILNNFRIYYDVSSNGTLKGCAVKYPTIQTHTDFLSTQNDEENGTNTCRILQVSDHQKKGGAAIAGHRLFSGLKSAHANVRLITFNDPPVLENGCYSWDQVLSANRGISNSQTPMLVSTTRKDWVGLVSAALDEATPQIINIHNIHEAIHYHGVPFNVLDVMARKARLVFTLHDMWLFTGRCAYTGNCERYIDQSCNETCPTHTVYPQARPNDISGLLRVKKDFFKRNPEVIIVTPSQWLANQAKKSYLNNHSIEVIPYGIDTTVFRPDDDREDLRRSIGIPRNACVLLISAANLSDPRKGARLFLKALSKIKDDLIVLTVGKTNIQPELPKNIKFYNYGFVTSPEEMAFAYSVADLFICPSLEDNLPCVLIESISCGTPCIGFNVGGVPEVIRQGKTGWLAPETTSESLSGLITKLIKSPEKISTLRPTCREVAENEYALNIQAIRYLRLFHELIAQEADMSTHASGQPKNRENALESEYEKIQKYVDTGEIEAARIKLAKLVSTYPEFAVGHNDLGVLNYRMGLKKEALKHYEVAAQLQPDNIVFLKNLADCYYVEMGQIEEAMKLYVNVLKLEPKDIETLLVVGHLCVVIGKLSEAKDFYEKILEIDPENEEARTLIEKINVKNKETEQEQKDEEEPIVGNLVCLNDISPSKYVVTAIVSTYNAERFIRGCLEDLENQTIADKLEIVVINSGSKQNEEAIVREFQKKYDNIKYIRTDNRENVYAAWNRCIKVASGKYITNANTDDRHRKDAYEIMVKTLENHPSVSLVYADVIITEKENEILDQCSPVGYFRWLNWNRDDLLDKGCFMGPQPMWRRNVHMEYGYFDDSFVTSGDYEFWLRISQTSEFLHIPEILGLYLRSSDSIEHTNRKMQAVENKRILRMYKNANHAGKIIRKNWANNKPAKYISKNHTHTRPQLPVPESLYRDIISETSTDRPQTTINKLENLLKDFPDFAVVHNELGVLHYKYGSNTKVLASYLKAVELEPENVTFRKNLADFLYVEEGRVEEALENYVEVLRIKPDDVETLLVTGHICTSIDRYEDAMSFYKKVLNIEPGNLDARKNLEVLERRQISMLLKEERGEEKTDGAAEINQAEPQASVDELTIVKDGVVEELINKAELLFQQERIDQAVDAMLKAIAVNQLDGRTYIELARQLINHGSNENALEVLAEMPANQPEALEKQKLVLEGYCQEGMGNYAAAKKCNDGVLACEPKSTKALNLNGILAYRNGDKETAEQHFKRAIELDSEYGEPHTNLGALVWENGKPKMALEHYERGFSISPTDIDVANAYHEAATATGEYKRAEKAARSALKKYPQCRKVLYLLVDTLIRQKKNEEALKELENALSTFGVDEGLLDTALAFRERVGKIKKTGSDKKPGVSLCMIVKDEEDNLARCLASVKPIVDEMIVVDTGSTDRTRDIAEFLGARVYDFEWKDDFAEARNFSLSKAKGGWILILDADEVISSKDYVKFQSIVRRRPKKPIAYSITTRNYCTLANTIGWETNLGEYPAEEAGFGWLPSAKVRLFYGRSRVRFEGAVHEMVDPALKRAHIPVKSCHIPVHHYGRLDTERMNKKGKIYYDLGRRKLEESNCDHAAVRELATQATILGKNEEAVDLWHRFLKMSPPDRAIAEAHVNLATLYLRLQDYKEARNISEKVLSKVPEMKEARYNLALSELYLGNPGRTVEVLECMVKDHPLYPPAQFILAATCFINGKKEQSESLLENLKKGPFGPVLTRSFAELVRDLNAAGRFDYAQQLIGSALENKIVDAQILTQLSLTLPNSPQPVAVAG